MSDYKVIFPTLPTGAAPANPTENEASNLGTKEFVLTPPPVAVQTGQSADVMRLEPPAAPAPPPAHQTQKEDDALRTIGEVSALLNLPASVIRFWETRFYQLKPVQRSDGRRYYRKEDVEFLGGISRLLREEGYTIKGAVRLIRKEGIAYIRAKGKAPLAEQEDRTNQILLDTLGRLEQLHTRVKKLVA